MKSVAVIGCALLCLVFTTSIHSAQSQLATDYPAAFLEDAILEPADWVPYPTSKRPEEWQALLPAGKYAALIANAEPYLGFDWPVGKASLFLEYVTVGNRTRYASVHNARRKALVALVMAEVVEGQGRFLEDIVNGVWAISEETFWGVPAHLGLQEKGHGLADVNDPVVDLFAAQTAQILAWTSYLLGDALDGVHPMIRERIYIETDRRIFRVIESQPGYRWTGAMRTIDDPTLSYERRSFMQRRPNNWNPWISSNLLTCILLLEQDSARRANFVHQVFAYLDNYLDPHPADGGSDEGTSYWGHAAGSTFDSFDLVHMATQGAFDEFDRPLIVNMGEFITRAYIGDGYFVNFADASPRPHHSPMLVYRFGKAVGSEAMMGMGAYLAGQADFANKVPEGRSLLRNLPELLYTRELLEVEAAEPLLADSWLPDIQVLFSRDEAGSVQGLYLSRQGRAQRRKPQPQRRGQFSDLQERATRHYRCRRRHLHTGLWPRVGQGFGFSQPAARGRWQGPAKGQKIQRPQRCFQSFGGRDCACPGFRARLRGVIRDQQVGANVQAPEGPFHRHFGRLRVCRSTRYSHVADDVA